ncbi:DUF3658 domain-containing protein [Roseateles amylovorans]|uniref:DUF3658 domain-containing protein n=1 Tax=Roseateles amylovorans TaxID=2978473 RepID=A0ABY6AZI3_9BURK|nr:DUF3658 domain-containing protein [Roseateles amylovorans]UXH76490.1 DUF3658 domain-containing protein [Roseateles amylovorans]
MTSPRLTGRFVGHPVEEFQNDNARFGKLGTDIVTLSQEELDALILESVKPWGTKVAAIMANVDRALKARQIHDDDDAFDDTERRLRALIDSGHLLSDGDLNQWRTCEVRTPSRID